MHYSRSWFVQKEYKRCSWHFRNRKCVQMQAHKCNWQIHKYKCKSRQKQNLIEDDTGRGVIPNSQTHTPHSDDHRLSLMRMSWTFKILNFKFSILRLKDPTFWWQLGVTHEHFWKILDCNWLISKNTNCKFSAPKRQTFSLTIFHQAYIWIHVSRLVH